MKVILKGGPGSGHRGHGGRPGQVGGSSAGGSGPGKGFGKSPTKRSTPITGDEAGINTAEIIEFDDGTKGVFKSKEGMEFGTIEGEVVTYEFSESLGWNIVPETVVYDKDGKIGSLQKFVSGQTGIELMDDMGGGDLLNHGIDSERISVMDDLLFNGDRHAGNYIVDGDKIWAIDNGASLGDTWTTASGKIAFDFEPSIPSINQFWRAKFDVDEGIKDTWKVYGEIAQWHSSGKSASWLTETTHIDAARQSKLVAALDEWVGLYDEVDGG